MPECSSATQSFGVRVAGVAVFETLCSSLFLHGLRIEAGFVGWVHVAGVTGAFNQIRVSPELLFPPSQMNFTQIQSGSKH